MSAQIVLIMHFYLPPLRVDVPQYCLQVLLTASLSRMLASHVVHLLATLSLQEMRVAFCICSSFQPDNDIKLPQDHGIAFESLRALGKVLAFLEAGSTRTLPIAFNQMC